MRFGLEATLKSPTVYMGNLAVLRGFHTLAKDTDWTNLELSPQPQPPPRNALAVSKPSKSHTPPLPEPSPP